MIAITLLLALACARGPGSPPVFLTLGENRLFLGRVHLEGPLGAVRFDCGGAGEVRLLADLAPGETRDVELAFPLRAPLGLAGIPFPVVDPVRGPGVVRFEGWSEEQPGAAFDRFPAGLVSRTRPPLPAEWLGEVEGGSVGWALLGLAVSGGLAVIAARRRSVVAFVVGSAFGGVLLVAPSRLRASGGGGNSPRARTEVLEIEAGPGRRGVHVESGETARLRDAIHLEVEPEGFPLSFVLQLEAEGTAGSALVFGRPGPRLTVFRPAAAEEGWGPELPAPRTLGSVWARSPDGSWSARGPWRAGTTLPPALPSEDPRAGPPPGWLVAGLPPGRSVLVGVTDPGHWLRIVGF